MKNIAIAAIVASTLLASAPAFAAGGHVPAACKDGTAPEGWLRAGGYCELVERGPETTSKKGSPPPVVVTP